MQQQIAERVRGLARAWRRVHTQATTPLAGSLVEGCQRGARGMRGHAAVAERGQGLPAVIDWLGFGQVRLINTPFAVLTGIVYGYLPLMVLPIYVSLERLDKRLLEASADLGASRAQTFRTVILPLAMPGVIAGSIFTFSLTLGDYIIPQIIGDSSRFIGLTVYQLQGTAGNTPLAAAFAVVPILIMVVYLWLAKRAGAFDAL